MKKLFMYVLALTVAFAPLSCKKDNEAENGGGGKEGGDTPPAVTYLTPAEQQAKLDLVGEAVLKEVDPDIWHVPAETALEVVMDAQKVKAKEGHEIGEILSALFITIEKQSAEASLYIARLSKLTGDITVETSNEVDPETGEAIRYWKYTEGTNPLCVTYLYNEKTYTVTFSAQDSDQLMIYRVREESVYDIETGEYMGEQTNYYSLYVPTIATLVIKENGSDMLTLEVKPTVTGLDENHMLCENTVIKGSASLKAADYALVVSDLSVSEKAAATKVVFSHNTTKILEAQVEGTYTLAEAVKASIGGLEKLDASGTIRIMNGAVIIKASAKSFVEPSSDPSTKEGAQALASAINASSKVDIYFDNNESVVQSSVIALPVSTDESGWTVLPGFHFYDGSNDLAYYDFLTEEAFPKTMAQLGSVVLHFREYFGKYYMHER